jgi:hypothetical protein
MSTFLVADVVSSASINLSNSVAALAMVEEMRCADGLSSAVTAGTVRNVYVALDRQDCGTYRVAQLSPRAARTPGSIWLT